MRIHKSHFPFSPPLAAAVIVILLVICFSVLSANASSPWVEVHPRVIPEASGIALIRFIDANIGGGSR